MHPEVLRHGQAGDVIYVNFSERRREPGPTRRQAELGRGLRALAEFGIGPEAMAAANPQASREQIEEGICCLGQALHNLRPFDAHRRYSWLNTPEALLGPRGDWTPLMAASDPEEREFIDVLVTRELKKLPNGHPLYPS